MTNVHIVLLGLLIKEPLYGYEIKQIIEEHMGDWTDIKFGSIYFALERLKKEGKVAIEREEKGGKRPARRVYSITEKGREEYTKLLRKLWTEDGRVMYPLDIAMFFIDSLSEEEVAQYIDARIQAYREALKRLDEHETEQLHDTRVPKQAKYIFDHSKIHLEAELNWLIKISEDSSK